MNWLDILLCVVVVASALIGLRHGFIKEVAHFGGAIAALIIASRTHQEFSHLLAEWLGEGALLRVVSFFAVFVIVYVGAILLGWLLSGSLKTLKLGWMDKALGVFFGAARGALIVLLLLIALILVLPSSHPSGTLASSSVYTVLEPGVRMVSRLMPGSLGEEIRQRDEMHRSAEGAVKPARGVSI